jgi:hypothetical protein
MSRIKERLAVAVAYIVGATVHIIALTGGAIASRQMTRARRTR